jgi:asparagine synthase (glutamine-hydrolysing)
MRFSIESRTPFADDRHLIETVASIPSVYKIHDGYSKWLLREAMRSFLPERISRRTDKVGFATPGSEWIAKNKTILASYLEWLPREILKVDAISARLSRATPSLPARMASALWRCVNLGAWWKIFQIDGFAK